MIQYNLARLRSMPANQNYLDGFERMRCEAIQKDGERCKKWKEGDSAWCWEHSADNAGDAEISRIERDINKALRLMNEETHR